MPDPSRLDSATAAGDDTAVLLQLAFGHRFNIDPKGDFVVKFLANDLSLVWEGIGKNRFDPASGHSKGCVVRPRPNGIGRSGVPYRVVEVLPSKPAKDLVSRPFHDFEGAPSDEPYLVLEKLSYNNDILQWNILTPVTREKPYRSVLPASWAFVDAIPVKHLEFGALIPAIMHVLEVHLISQRLSSGLLHSVGVSDIDLIRTAISSRTAGEPVNYERLEFIGDSILKFHATIAVMIAEPTWFEGYLTAYRSRLVSNSQLFKVAVEFQLDRYILFKRKFVPRLWRPVSTTDQTHGLLDSDGRRTLPTKTVADVVEALVGAAFLDGGLNKARNCIELIIRSIPWHDIENGRRQMQGRIKIGAPLAGPLEPVERLIGHRFGKKSVLVEALTHFSFAVKYQTMSYEQLEFLGDALLDYLVINRLRKIQPSLTHTKLHLAKTALVNGPLLAFLALELSHEQSVTDASPDGASAVSRTARKPLCLYMLFDGPAVAGAMQQVQRRHQAVGTRIRSGLRSGSARYPWSLLAGLAPPKCMSDIVESLLAAIWLDAAADAEDRCLAFLDHLGLFDLVATAEATGWAMNLFHPKEQLGLAFPSQKIAYVVSRRSTEPPNQSSASRYNCCVEVDGITAGSCELALTRDEAETRAAEDALIKAGVWQVERSVDDDLPAF